MKNILFLSFIKYKTINVHDFYADILRNYVKDGHHVYVVTPVESKYGIETSVLKETGCDILHLIKNLWLLLRDVPTVGVLCLWVIRR